MVRGGRGSDSDDSEQGDGQCGVACGLTLTQSTKHSPTSTMRHMVVAFSTQLSSTATCSSASVDSEKVCTTRPDTDQGPFCRQCQMQPTGPKQELESWSSVDDWP